MKTQAHMQDPLEREDSGMHTDRNARGTVLAATREIGIAVAWIVALLVPRPGLCAINWTTTSDRLKATIGQERIVAEFPFRNSGDRSVQIVSVKPSCGCIVAKLGKEVYAPSESGTLRAELDLTNAVGLQSKTIVVTTDDTSHPTTVLNLIVDVPEPVIIRPRLLFWVVGSKADQKTAEIILGDPKLVQLNGFEASNSLFAVQLEPRSAAGGYVLRVTPQNTSSLQDAVIRLNATVAGRPQTFTVFLAVK